MNLYLNNLPRTKTIHHVVFGDFDINLLNTSFTASWLIEFMESSDFSLKNREPTKQRRISISLIDLCFANFTLYCEVDQTDITNHFSVIGKIDIFKVENIPLENILMRDLEETENETHLNQLRNWMSFAIQDCEEEFQN